MMGLGATPVTAETGQPHAVRRVAFCVCAAFILLLPMLPQVFDLRSPLLRSWRMYSDVGVGILKGSFRVQQPDGAVRSLSPLEMMGLEVYPRIRHFHFQQRIMASEDLGPLTSEFCRALDPTHRLSFEGAVGTPRGWQALNIPDLCGSSHARRD